jgi:hypothetical protein
LRRYCLLWQVIEGKIKGGIRVTGRQGRRRRTLLDDLKERRGYSYLNEETLDRTMWRARFGRDFGPVVRQTAKWMNERNNVNWLVSVTETECVNCAVRNECLNIIKNKSSFRTRSWITIGLRTKTKRVSNRQLLIDSKRPSFKQINQAVYFLTQMHIWKEI